MQNETITYQADGAAMQSQLFCPTGGGKHPGVLVFPEAFGLGANALERAKRLAGLGYVALAADYYGEAQTLDSLEAALAVLGPIAGDADRTRNRGLAALQALAARPEVEPGRIAAIGFCFGGTMALELARAEAGIVAAIGFHSGLSTQRPATKVSARVLACIGADDPMITAEHRTTFQTEMAAAGADWQVHVYGGVVHSFTNRDAASVNKPDAIRYSPEADRRSWAAMLELFGEVLGS